MWAARAAWRCVGTEQRTGTGAPIPWGTGKQHRRPPWPDTPSPGTVHLERGPPLVHSPGPRQHAARVRVLPPALALAAEAAAAAACRRPHSVRQAMWGHWCAARQGAPRPTARVHARQPRIGTPQCVPAATARQRQNSGTNWRTPEGQEQNRRLGAPRELRNCSRLSQSKLVRQKMRHWSIWKASMMRCIKQKGRGGHGERRHTRQGFSVRHSVPAPPYEPGPRHGGRVRGRASVQGGAAGRPLARKSTGHQRPCK